MAGRRRFWSLEQKLAIVAEAERCDNLTALARRHDIRTSLLYTWRREFRYAREAVRSADRSPEPSFVPAVVSEGGSAAQGVKDVSIEVEMGGAVVRISPTAAVRVVTAVIAALKAT